ncbi:MAG: hypothetical protein KDD36_07295 [Flavobacteriales bacterium]|nr:hypothetical protein [Flavobacteriales bacterium]
MNPMIKNGFLRFGVCFLLIATACGTAFAQDTAKGLPFPIKPEFTLEAGMMRFYGDVGYDQLNEPYKTKPGFQLEIRQEIKPAFHVGFFFLAGKVEASEKSLERNLNFQTPIYSGGFQAFYDFSTFLPSQRVLTPYVNLGISYMYFKPKGDLFDANNEPYYYWDDGSIRNMAESDPNAGSSIVLQRDYVYETNLQNTNLDGFGNYPLTSFVIPVGGGVSMNITPEISFKVGTNFHYTLTDFIDNITEEGEGGRKGRGGNDKFMFTYFGASYLLNLSPTEDDLHFQGVDFFVLGETDEDMDGVKDVDDLCPETPEGQPVDLHGCPMDDDNDGIPNFRDEEPATLQDTLVDTRGKLMTPKVILDIYMEYIDSTGDFGFDSRQHIQEEAEYRILVGTFDEGIPADMMDAFLNLEDLRTEKNDKGQTVITVGSFRTAEEAEVRRQVLENSGISGTEVVQWVPEFLRGVDIDEEVVTRLQGEQTEDEKTMSFDKVLYRVQLGAFSKVVPEETFHGIKDLNSLKTENGMYKYMSGTFYQYKEAVDHKINMLVKGFEGAFVVAYKDGKRINITQALAAEEAAGKEEKTTPANDPVLPSDGNNAPKQEEEDHQDQENHQDNEQAAPENDNGEQQSSDDTMEEVAPPEMTTDSADQSMAVPTENPFESDPSLAEMSDDYVKFMVVLAEFRGDIPVDDLTAVLSLEGAVKDETGDEEFVRYHSEEFDTYNQAKAFLSDATNAGVKQPEMVALHEGETITLDEAASLLSEE